MESTVDSILSRVQIARHASVEAGKILLKYRGRVGEIRRKGAVDLLTIADREAEALVVSVLRAVFPDDAIVGEEGGRIGDLDDPWCWYIDPLDGTTNYVHGLDNFAVSIGLTFQGRLVAGVVHAPCRGVTYHATAGGGAWADDTPIQVCGTEVLGDALLVTGFPYDRRETAAALTSVVARALTQARGVRRHGSAALDLVDVAQGLFGGYWETRLSPWDMAGGVVIVQEAGGTVTGYLGRAFDLHGDSIIATNRCLHGAVVRMVGDG